MIISCENKKADFILLMDVSFPSEVTKEPLKTDEMIIQKTTSMHWIAKASFASAIFAIILTNSHSFGRTFFWIVPLMILSLILGLFMPEKPLSKEMIDVAAGKEEVPEY